MAPAPFVIFSLPRSRSAWLATYLSYGTRRCGHDVAIECNTMADFLGGFACNGGPLAGTCETGAVLGWQVMRAKLPRCKMTVVIRPLGEVYDSLARKGVVPQDGELEGRLELLESVGSLPGNHRLEYSWLSEWDCCEWIFQHHLRVPWDEDWYEHLAPMNIQVDMPQRVAQLHRRFSALEGLKASVQGEIAKLAPCPDFQ